MEHLRDHSHGVTSRLLSIADVQQAVVQQFNIALADLTGARRTQNLVQPRQVAMYLCRQLLSSSFPEIARNFGGRDHSTVIYACTKMEEAMRMDTQVRAVIDGLTTQLQEAMSARE
jgi:chromosomal replication initiator protein